MSDLGDNLPRWQSLWMDTPIAVYITVSCKQRFIWVMHILYQKNFQKQ